MRLIASILCVIAFGSAWGQEGMARGRSAWAWAAACASQIETKQPETKPKMQIIPPGYHAHRRIDGTVIVHRDNSDAASHAGVASPWVQIAGAGERVPADLPTRKAMADDDCPPEG